MSFKDKSRSCVLAFFGIDRRLDLTSPSIRAKIFEPAQALFDVQARGHLWSVSSIDSQRSGESGDLVPPRISLLPEGQYTIEPPLDLSMRPEFQTICEFGDFWKDGFKSLGNLYSQLVSLQRVTQMALELSPDCVVFARPDLMYHDSLDRALKAAWECKTDAVFLPHWQPHSGYNDRFAVCRGERAIEAYGLRLQSALELCESTGQPLHSEKLVAFALNRGGIEVRRIRARASRVRINGRSATEDFSILGWKPAVRVFLGKIRRDLGIGRRE